MKRFFETLGFVCLICFSFFYTEKTMDVVKEVDEIMVTLKEQEQKYQVPAENASIDGDIITPGISGKIVNRKESYEQMKHYGKFYPSLLKYDKVSPEVSIKDRYDLYVRSGNPKIRQVSLLFLIEKNTEIDSLISVLKEEEIGATFFIDANWLNQNQERLTELTETYTIGNYSIGGDYEQDSFTWMNTIIKRIGGQKQGYCLVTEKNQSALNHCTQEKNYTIYPSIIVKENPYTEITSQIKNGSIILLPSNQQVKEELKTVIAYLKQKGYQIVTLEQMLTE